MKLPSWKKNQHIFRMQLWWPEFLKSRSETAAQVESVLEGGVGGLQDAISRPGLNNWGYETTGPEVMESGHASRVLLKWRKAGLQKSIELFIYYWFIVRYTRTYVRTYVCMCDVEKYLRSWFEGAVELCKRARSWARGHTANVFLMKTYTFHAARPRRGKFLRKIDATLCFECANDPTLKLSPVTVNRWFAFIGCALG